MIMNKFHGIFSLLLIFLSFMIGILVILNESLTMAVLYISAIIVFIPLIIYSFCSKCNCRLDSCGHILPGLLSRLLPARKQSKYTAFDYTGVVLPFIILVVFPQFRLWDNTILLIIFWLALLISFAEVRLFVCKRCGNKYCPGCKGELLDT
jgi:hypothetical protein